MAGAAEREALKQRALLALADSRRALTGEMARVSVLLHPRQFFQESLRKHRIAYILGAAVVGFIGLRILWVPRGRAAGAGNAVGNEAGPASLISRLTGLATALLWPMVRGPVMTIAGRFLSSYLSKFYPPPSEGTE